MKCKFTLQKVKGGEVETIHFDNELLLDDYIYGHRLTDATNDIVFSRTTRASETFRIVSENNKEFKKFLKDKVYSMKDALGHDLSLYEFKSPLIGVNKFLASIRTESSDGKLHPLFPIFREDAYWNKKRIDWSNGIMTDDEMEEIKAIVGADQIKNITQLDVFDKVRQAFTEKWTEESKFGNALHEFMRFFWGITETRQKIRKMESTEIAKLFTEHFNKIKDEKFLDGSNKYAELTEAHIRQMIEYAKNLNNDIIARFGKDVIIMPEVALLTQLNFKIEEEPNVEQLMGVMDLLVIDEFGNAHVIDYKTSPKPYPSYDDAKVSTFKYQLAVYRRLLERSGLNPGAESGLFIAPLELKNFLKKDGKWTFDAIKPWETPGKGINSLGNPLLSYLVDLTADILKSQSISYYVDLVLPVETSKSIEPKDTLSYVEKWMRKWFERFDSQGHADDDEAIKYIHKHKLDVPNKKGEYTYLCYYPPMIRTFKDEGDVKGWQKLIPWVKKDLMGREGLRGKWALSIKRDLSEAKKAGYTHIDIPGMGSTNGVQDTEYLTHVFEKYLHPNWEIMGENESGGGWEALEHLGMIVFKNKITKQIEVIKISNLDLDAGNYLNGRKGLTSTFEPDVIEEAKLDSLMLESVNGNIELMEAMLALNANPELFRNNEATIGNMIVVNPRNHTGLLASNKELLYCFNRLAKLSKMEENNFSDYNKSNSTSINFRTSFDIVRDHLYEIMSLITGPDHIKTDKKWANYGECLEKLEICYLIDDPSQKRLELVRLNEMLESREKGFNLTGVQITPYSVSQSPQIKLQLEVLTAIAEIDGYDMRLQIRDDSSYWQNMNVLKHGHSGIMLDNLGFLSNPSLNRLAKGTTIAYLNIRDDVLKVKDKLKVLVEAVKKELGFNYILERTIGNQSSIYDGMTRVVNGDLQFVDPSELTGAKKKLLEFILETINKNRLNLPPDASEDYIKDSLFELRIDSPDLYYKVPLTLASTSSKMHNIGGIRGLFASLLDRLKAWNPFGVDFKGNVKNAATEFRKKVEGFVGEDAEENYKRVRDNSIWHMINSFESSDTNDDYRLHLIKEEGGIENFETNLETLCLEHTFAYSKKKNMDEILPMVRATMTNMAAQSLIGNTQKGFQDSLDYISKYVRNKIFNLSLIDEKAKSLKVVLGKLQSGASKLALAFSPVLFYLHLDGIWKDIQLFTKNKFGANVEFTASNLKDAYFFAYKDLFHYGNGNSLTEQLNELYGINDMDMNTYIDKIKSDLSGIWNFDLLMFRFASRPDFYNRMTIFGAQMRSDGSWKAHHLNKETGRLEYDWTEDERFNVFAKYAKNPESVPADLKEKFDSQKAMYIAMANQLVKEHTRNKNGSLFQLNLSDPQALPKAYTTEQAEGMKALGDMIYGYYSHEKKSLWLSTTLGSLFMLMNTYWSSKKNQYLAPGGIKYMGRMELYSELVRDEQGEVITENGKPKSLKYWQVVNPDGSMGDIINDEQLTKDMKVIPFMQWKGQFHEGIFVTLASLFATFFNPEANFKGGIKDRWKIVHERYWNNPDETLRQAYRNNIVQGWYDLLMWLLIGMIVGPALNNAAADFKKEEGNDSLLQAAENTSLQLGATLVTNSGADFNALKSIFGLGVSWTPFSIQTYSRLISNIGQTLGGDKSFYDMLVSTNSAMRSTRPVWDYIGDSTGWNISRNEAAEDEM